MRVEIVAIGTELLLGQIQDTNSAWLGEQLAAAGIDSHFHQAVGDNPRRMVMALRTALSRSDAVIVCGGLGPTQDDITREAIAEVMNVDLVVDEGIVAVIAEMFSSRGREMSENNRRQAEVPVGASIIPQTRGTAPGLICPVGNKVVYAVPGVPYEMSDMFERAILPDLRARIGDEDAAAGRGRRRGGEPVEDGALGAEAVEDDGVAAAVFVLLCVGVGWVGGRRREEEVSSRGSNERGKKKQGIEDGSFIDEFKTSNPLSFSFFIKSQTHRIHSRHCGNRDSIAARRWALALALFGGKAESAALASSTSSPEHRSGSAAAANAAEAPTRRPGRRAEM